MALKVLLRYPLYRLLFRSVLHQIDGIALLDVIVIKMLCVYLPALSPQYRAVPEGGMAVKGYFIPIGMWISTSLYCLHQHASAYLDVDKWKPERWMIVWNAKAKQSVDSASVGEEVQEDDPRW